MGDVITFAEFVKRKRLKSGNKDLTPAQTTLTADERRIVKRLMEIGDEITRITKLQYTSRTIDEISQTAEELKRLQVEAAQLISEYIRY